MRARPVFKFLLTLASPWMKLYLKKERTWSRGGLRLKILPGVFHPGILFSTHLLLDEIEKENLEQKKILDIGCGSGAISLVAAYNKAKVIAIKLEVAGIEYTFTITVRKV